jgi:hypothetical protein
MDASDHMYMAKADGIADSVRFVLIYDWSRAAIDKGPAPVPRR